jgi:hypothetical protein
MIENKTKNPETLTQLDAEIADWVATLSQSQVVRELVDILGAPLVAMIGDVQDTRSVRDWIDGSRQPQSREALMFALHLATLIRRYIGDAHVAQAWFQGAKPRLRDETPALLLADDELDDVRKPLLAEVRIFLAN